MSKIEWRRVGGGRWIATVTRDEEAAQTALNNLLAGALAGAWGGQQTMFQHCLCPYCQQPRPYWSGGPIPGPGLFGGILGGLGI